MKYVVDRIEADAAVLEAPDGSVYSVPAALLPSGAGEGSVIAVMLDGGEEKKRRKTAAQLMKKVWKD